MHAEQSLSYETKDPERSGGISEVVLSYPGRVVLRIKYNPSWKILWFGNSTWDFLGVNFWSDTRSFPVTWNRENFSHAPTPPPPDSMHERMWHVPVLYCGFKQTITIWKPAWKGWRGMNDERVGGGGIYRARKARSVTLNGGTKMSPCPVFLLFRCLSGWIRLWTCGCLGGRWRGFTGFLLLLRFNSKFPILFQWFPWLCAFSITNSNAENPVVVIIFHWDTRFRKSGTLLIITPRLPMNSQPLLP